MFEGATDLGREEGRELLEEGREEKREFLLCERIEVEEGEEKKLLFSLSEGGGRLGCIK